MDTIYISEEEEDEEEEEEEDDDERSSDESSFDSESDQSQPLPSATEPSREFCFEGKRIALPEGLCQDENIFNEFFSLEMWNNHLTSEHRTLLMVSIAMHLKLKEYLFGVSISEILADISK
jgi:hypothetical protein